MIPSTLIRQVYDWYWGHIPQDEHELNHFLAKAINLARAMPYFERPNTIGFTGQAYAQNEKSGLEQTLFIPDWINTITNPAVKTALWNYMLSIKYASPKLVGTEKLGSVKIDKNLRVTYANFGELLFANEHLYKRMPLFAQITNKIMYTEEYAYQTLKTLVVAALNPELNTQQAILEHENGEEVCQIIELLKQETENGVRLDYLNRLYDLLEDETEQPQTLPQEELTQTSVKASREKEIVMAIETALAGWDKEQDEAGTIIVSDIITLPYPQTEIVHDPRFDRVGDILQQLQSKQEPPVFPYYQGTELLDDELYRINIDGHCLGNPLEERDFTDKKIILLGDMSGSTETAFGTSPQNLWYKILAGLKGAFISLRKTNIETEVYVHTSTKDKTPLLYFIANNLSSDHDRRFDLATYDYRWNNYDNIILNWLLNNRCDTDKTVFIWVLSDGQPCGNAGIEKTKAVVDLARKEGIHVWSFSLATAVVPNNDEIYGEEFNFPAENLDQTLEKALLNLA